jgi:PAS domain S-box-containing protein
MNDLGLRAEAFPRSEEVTPTCPSPFPAAFVSTGDLLNRLPIGIYTCDREGRVIEYNRRAAELWGDNIGSDGSHTRFCNAHKLFLSDGTPLPQDWSPMRELLQSQETVRDRTVIVEDQDGGWATLLVNVEPVFDERGAIAGAVTYFQETSGPQRVEAHLQASANERRLREMLEALPAAVYTTDTQGRLTFYNEAAARLWGCRPELGSAQWCGSWRLCWPDGTPMQHDECPMAVAIKHNRPTPGAEAVAIRPDGSRVPFLAYPTLLRDASGTASGAVNMLVDITERKQADARQKILLDELNHRVKNTLATVQALAAQSLRNADAPEDQRRAFEARLCALSRTHDQLTRERWEWAELSTIVREIFAPYRTTAGDRIRLEGAPVRLAPTAALTLAMILNELATNAAKYGSLSVPAGKLDVSWVICGGDGSALWLDWFESDGPPVSPPKHRGFGTRFLERGVTQQLQGTAEIDFDPGGFRCSMRIPLPADRARSGGL